MLYSLQQTQSQQKSPHPEQQQLQEKSCNGSAYKPASATSEVAEGSGSHSSDAKNTLLLHCCCVIVQITPVAPGRSHVTTTASSTKKPGAGDDGGGGGLATGGRTPVCRCNAQYKLQDLKALQALQQQQQQQQQLQQQSATLNTNVSSSTPAIPGSSAGSHQHHHHPTLSAQSSSVPSQSQKQSQELTNEELIRYLYQINTDNKWIEQLKQYKYEIEKLSATEKTDSRNIKQQQQQQQHQQQQLVNGHIPSKSKPAAADTSQKQQQQPSTGAIAKSTEFFDRSLKQRHSSRSVDERTARRGADDEEYGKEGGHQRHSSGPSDLQQFKYDISEWLLNLPLKKSVELLQQAKSAQLALEKEQQEAAAAAAAATAAAVAKKPLQRQSSGGASERTKHSGTMHRQHSGGEIRLTQDDILEWIKKQQFCSKVNEETSAAPKKFKEKEEIPLQHHFEHKQSKSSSKLQKRHSLGPNEEFFHKTTEWIQYPLKQLKKHTFDPLVAVASTADVRSRKDRDHHRERKLRHSASEVVTSTHSDQPIQQPTRVAPQKPERTFRYQSKEREPKVQQHHSYPLQQPPPQQSTTSFIQPKPAKRERSRRNKTQRSATVADINHSTKKQPSQKHHVISYQTPHRSQERSLSMSQCTDPMCSALSLCQDPNCYIYDDYYDTPRCASLPRVKTTEAAGGGGTLPLSATNKCGPLCYECNNKCNSLPRCTDARCTAIAGTGYPESKLKSNSLPRNAETAQQKRLSREDSRSSLPRSSRPKKRSASSGNGKLTKSVSAASLNSRRRRHKTVHFGENLLREVCQNRKLIQPLQQQETPSGTTPLQPNIQMLYNFVEGVLSAWVDDEDEQNKSGPDSEPERGAMLKPMHRCNRARFQTIRRVVNEAAELKGSSKLGNSRYRHRHWRGTAKDCNERFLRK
ncbi:hypothetical protein pipiens_008150, partial [Culex pipiens pipiens]